MMHCKTRRTFTNCTKRRGCCDNGMRASCMLLRQLFFLQPVHLCQFPQYEQSCSYIITWHLQ